MSEKPKIRIVRTKEGKTGAVVDDKNLRIIHTSPANVKTDIFIPKSQWQELINLLEAGKRISPGGSKKWEF